MEALKHSTKEKYQSNGEINSNKTKEANGTNVSKTTIGKLRKSQSLMAVIRFFIECIVVNALLLPLVLPLLPLVVLYNILKLLEEVVARFMRGSIAMSGQDAIWQQSTDKNRLIITSLFITEFPAGDPDKVLADFRKVILDRMVYAKNESGELIYPRCHWYIRPGYFQYFFEEDKDFSVKNHVYLWEGETPSSKEALQDIVSKISSEPLPQGVSPWFYCCIPTNFGDKSMAIAFRMDHSLADGVSLSRFLSHQLPDNVIPEKEARKFSSRSRALMTVKAAFIIARYLVKLMFTWADRSILHGPEVSGVKKVVWSEPLDLKRIKEIKNATGTTVNDVIMACLSCALRGYQQKKGVKDPDEFTASIPVDVRPFNKKLAFENKFAVVFMKLPVHVSGSVEQLFETKARMDDVKISGEPLGMAWVMQLSIALFPNFLSKFFTSFVTRKASAVVSNVPGPQNFLTVCGCRINYMTFWPPQRDNVGLGVSICSYAGQVLVGVQSDAAILPEPQMVIEEFGRAVDDLSDSVLVGHTNDCNGPANGHGNGLSNGYANGHTN